MLVTHEETFMIALNVFLLNICTTPPSSPFLLLSSPLKFVRYITASSLPTWGYVSPRCGSIKVRYLTVVQEFKWAQMTLNDCKQL